MRRHNCRMQIKSRKPRATTDITKREWQKVDEKIVDGRRMQWIADNDGLSGWMAFIQRKSVIIDSRRKDLSTPGKAVRLRRWGYVDKYTPVYCVWLHSLVTVIILRPIRASHLLKTISSLWGKRLPSRQISAWTYTMALPGNELMGGYNMIFPFLLCPWFLLGLETVLICLGEF